MYFLSSSVCVLVQRRQRQKQQSSTLPFPSFLPQKCSSTANAPSLFASVIKGASVPLSQRLSNDVTLHEEKEEEDTAAFDHLEAPYQKSAAGQPWNSDGDDLPDLKVINKQQKYQSS